MNIIFAIIVFHYSSDLLFKFELSKEIQLNKLNLIGISNILRNQKVFFSELKTNWYSSGTIASADAWGYVSEGYIPGV